MLPAGQPYEEKRSVGGFLGNVVESGANLVGGVASAIAHPIQTTKTLGKVALGGVQKLIPGQQESEQAFDALTGFYKERYGSLDALKRTLYEDPVGVAADLSTFLTGAGAAIGAVSKVGKVGTIAKVASTATRVGQALDPLQGIAKVVGVSATKMGPKLAKSLERANLRLTPSQTSTLGNKVNDVIAFNNKYKIAGSPESRYAKATALYETFEQELKSFLGGEARSVTTDKGKIISEIENLKQNYTNNRDFTAISRQIDDAIAAVQRQPDNVPLTNLNELKRSTYAQAYNKAGDKIADWVEHEVGDILRENIESATAGMKVRGRDIGQFNKDYGTLITSRRLLRLAQGRPQVGTFASRILGAMVGSSLGGAGGTFAGALFGPTATAQLPITAVRSFGASALSRTQGVQIPQAVKAAGKTLTPTTRVTQTQ